MKFALASYGTRGDTEPCAAVGLELLRRGHEVRMAVAPNCVGLVESAGLAAVAYGPDSKDEDFFRNFWKIQNPIRLVREAREVFSQGWAEMGRTLTSVAEGADLLLTHGTYQGVAANVAEYYDIPLATLHHWPVRVNGQVALPSIASPAPLVRSTMKLALWLYLRITRQAENAQRRDLGLPRVPGSAKLIAGRGSIEIQAYDELCFPRLAAEWAEWNGRRPFVGALTMDLPTDADDEVASWIAAGTPPIYFGFGSTPVQSPADTVAMIAAACAELRERALIYSAANDSNGIPHPDHVKLVGLVNYAKIFPACRAVVHHGGAGTLAASMRAGVPTLIFWTWGDQPLWAVQVERLKVGFGRRFSRTTRESLVADLRAILAPQYATRAREIATRMTKPAASVSTAADLLEDTARLGV